MPDEYTPMAELFGVGVNTINHHIKEIYKEKEQRPEATIRRYRIVQTEGDCQVLREIDFYPDFFRNLRIFAEINPPNLRMI